MVFKLCLMYCWDMRIQGTSVSCRPLTKDLEAELQWLRKIVRMVQPCPDRIPAECTTGVICAVVQLI